MMELNGAFVYVHLRGDDSSPFYVGMGEDVKRPWHTRVRSKSHKSIVKRHGIRVHIVADNLTWDDAQWWEVRWIKALKAAGYVIVNGTEGGDGLKNPTAEVRKKMSSSQLKRFENPEERAKLSQAFTGRITSEETKALLSKSSTGRRHTSKTIEKMKVAAKVRGVSDVTREAQRKAVTGRPRAPFSEETIAKMRIAATEREAKKRAQREA